MLRGGRSTRIDARISLHPETRDCPVIQIGIFFVTVLWTPDPIDVAAALVEY
jgi:hypothetical protein